MNQLIVYRIFEREFDKLAKPICTEYGLTSMELKILVCLYDNDKCDTSSQIADFLNATKSHISFAQKALVAKKLLIAERIDGNRKSMHLSLSESASEIAKRGHNLITQLKGKVFEGFSDDEMKTFDAMFQRIIDNVSLTSKKTGSKRGVAKDGSK